MKLSPLGRFLESLHNRSKLLSRIMLVIMAALVVTDLFVTAGYDRFWWESVSAAGAVYGLFACFVIVVVSKFLGYKFLYRKEDYFDDQRQGNDLIGDPKERSQGND
jgi:membrane associated rhomboid family serine protease